MTKKFFSRLPFRRVFASALMFVPLSGCDAGSSVPDAVAGSEAETVEATAGDIPEPSTPVQPVVRVTDLPPNELGEIMVLEYHRLGEPEGEFRRTAANFRADLQRLYDAGFRPITVRQMVSGDIDVPYGATPVVFTIDDSSTGQFYYLDDGSIDPISMMGMWEAFQAEHPDWSNGATWCVLPAAEHPSNFFSEKPDREIPRAEREDRIRRKVEHLVANGHEVCNHTLYHARLDRATGPAQVQEWIGRGEDSIQVYLPADYDIVTLALPLGMWPAEKSLAWKGVYRDREYSYEAVLEVSGGPNVSPFDVRFDPHSIDRTIVAPGHLERYLAGYEREPGRRFVSDGDKQRITVPAGQSSRVALDRWPGMRVEEAPSESDAPSSSTSME